MIDWKPGDYVVCIKEVTSHHKDTNLEKIWRKLVPNLPVVSCVYSLREVYNRGGVIGIRLNEIHNPIAKFADGFTEGAFQSQYFRKVITPNIDCFHQLLTNIPEHEFSDDETA